jgi:hypothetical protein
MYWPTQVHIAKARLLLAFAQDFGLTREERIQGLVPGRRLSACQSGSGWAVIVNLACEMVTQMTHSACRKRKLLFRLRQRRPRTESGDGAMAESGVSRLRLSGALGLGGALLALLGALSPWFGVTPQDRAFPQAFQPDELGLGFDRQVLFVVALLAIAASARWLLRTTSSTPTRRGRFLATHAPQNTVLAFGIGMAGLGLGDLMTIQKPAASAFLSALRGPVQPGIYVVIAGGTVMLAGGLLGRAAMAARGALLDLEWDSFDRRKLWTFDDSGASHEVRLGWNRKDRGSLTAALGPVATAKGFLDGEPMRRVSPSNPLHGRAAWVLHPDRSIDFVSSLDGHEVMAQLLFDPSAEQPRLLLDGSQIEGQDQPTHWTLSQQRSATFVAVGVEWARAGRLYGGFACLIFVVWRILEGL